eukprot:CAMPEP_0182549354 /NCGR_PEP_ID=MMETSP1323-20130603/40133_1 /TAXON_ID=236787 /ORGANISM="Florenciella parvula, Strain RCC1693" /LENGTH=86 /DNA_ID=CAMNT_0024760813 /DNA_START=174 /DNA_END=434 /DNA_ORIENTATION=+
MADANGTGTASPLSRLASVGGTELKYPSLKPWSATRHWIGMGSTAPHLRSTFRPFPVTVYVGSSTERVFSVGPIGLHFRYRCSRLS